MGKMDLTASFQFLIYLICGVICQINQRDCLQLCGWGILRVHYTVAHQVQSLCMLLFLSVVVSECVFLSCHCILWFCFETGNVNQRQLHNFLQP